MGQYTSYYLYQKYEKRGDQDWIPVYPNVYSVDGDGTMPLQVKVQNDEACGWHCDQEYQWVEVPTGESYVCDECEINVEYRWVTTSAYTYFGDYMYEILQEQFRKDGGDWIDTQNTKYGNPVKVDKKVKITMLNGDVFSQSCGDDAGVWNSYCSDLPYYYSENAIQYTSNVTEEEGCRAILYPSIPSDYSGCTKVEFGDCVYEIGKRYRGMSGYRSTVDKDVSESGEKMENVWTVSFCCTNIRELVLPDNLRWIGGNTFNNNHLTAVTLPSSVESIGYLLEGETFNGGTAGTTRLSQTFGNNKYLTNVSLNEGLKSIGGYDFMNCTSIERIDIPSTVESIGMNVFSGCTNLKQIVFKSETPPEFRLWRAPGASTTLSANSDTYIYVPCGSKNEYTEVITDIPSEKIVEYSGACGNIPSISSMYRGMFSYKVGNDTKTVYRSLSSDTFTITATSADISNVIDSTFVYPDEITILENTALYTSDSIVPPCKKLIIYGSVLTDSVQAIPTWAEAKSEEVVISTDELICFLTAGCTLKKVTISSGYSPTLVSCFGNDTSLEELHIDGNPIISNAGGNTSFIDCYNLRDIYITYTGSTIQVYSDADHPVFRGANPTVHVPCDLYNAYFVDEFWSQFHLVTDDEGCQTGGTPSIGIVEQTQYYYARQLSNFSYSGQSSMHDGEYIVFKVKNFECVVEVTNYKADGRFNYSKVYADDVLVYSEHGRSGTDTPVVIQNDGIEHLIKIESVWTWTGSGNVPNRFTIGSNQ